MAGEFHDSQSWLPKPEESEAEGRAQEELPTPEKAPEDAEAPGVVTERRRSRSGVTTPGASAAPLQEADDEAGREDDTLERAPETADGPLEDAAPFPIPRLSARRRGRKFVKKPKDRVTLSPQQRLLLLDTWRRSGLPARDFSALVGISRHTLYAWRKRFKDRGPEGLVDQPRGAPRGSRLSEITKRTILMLKEEHPDWGTQRISDMLLRGPALAASPGAVAKVLREVGYELEEEPTRPHRDRIRRFEREKANDLWQTDLFTFVLKRQNRRVYLVAFLDDYSRFIVGWGLRGSQSTDLVMETLRSAVVNYRTPREILTDNGSQYVTWRGKSAFSKELERRGIKQIVATPRRPQTLGKVERFWGSLWRECLEAAVFVDLEDARRRLGHYIDHYNFQRPHQGVKGLVPADRYFGAAPDVLRALKERVQANALELARDGLPKKPFYLTGQVAGEGFSVHAEGERVILQRGEGDREEVELVSPKPAEAEDIPESVSESNRAVAVDGEHVESVSPESPSADEIPESISESSGAPIPESEKHEEVPPPGTSALDRFLAQFKRKEGDGRDE